MQETQVWSLTQEDPNAAEQLNPYATAIEPGLRSPGAATPEPALGSAWALQRPLQWEALALKLKSNPCSQQLEKSPCNNKDPVPSKQINK